MSNVKGLKELLAKLENLSEETKDKVDRTLLANAQELEANAKIRAPKDLGKLAQSINAIKSGDLTYRVVASAPYAAYQEFGTGGLVQVPQEMKDIAIRFKGRGLREVNMRPQPYLYPSFVIQRKQVIEDLNALLDDEASKI